MANIRISADTTPFKKSIVDMGREINQLSKSGNKLSLISEKDRKFFKQELSQTLTEVKKKIQENKTEMSRLVAEASKVTKGSQEELKLRTRITEMYKTQARLSREAGVVSSARNNMGGGLGMAKEMGGGFMKQMGMGNIMSVLKSPALIGVMAAAAAAGWALNKASEGRAAYRSTTQNRDVLTGLGVNSHSMLSPAALAASGLDEASLIERRVRATSILGRAGGSAANLTQQAGFERSFGLEGGSLMNVATSLRSNFGAKGANDVQMKLQSSILANGIDEAIGPYLETATALLSRINENGMTSTAQMISVLGNLTGGSGRTVEQISRTFGDINSGVMGASGEANAFIQAAFARGGIGGGTIGGTRLAMEAGGLFGMDSSTMSGRYNPALMRNLRGAGFFDNMSQRGGALLNQFKASGGLGQGQSISGISNINQYVGMNSMANSVFGTSGAGGFEALQLLEKAVQSGQSPKAFQKELNKLKAGNDPVAKRLDTVNNTLSGQLTQLESINKSLKVELGENQGNAMTLGGRISNAATKGLSAVTGALIGSGGDNPSLKNSLSGIPEFNRGNSPMMYPSTDKQVEAINEQTKVMKQIRDKQQPNVKPEINIRTNGRKVTDKVQ